MCDLIDATDMQFQRYGLASEHSKDEVRAWSSTGPFRIELPDGSETEVQWAEWDQLAAEAAFDDDEDFAHEEILAEWNRRYGTAVPEAGAR
ncbi:MAG TPA: hypothetical protein VFF79_13045 [Conexibacter sp.]|nr:hypothetical protein [Conexibacter sp.]